MSHYYDILTAVKTRCQTVLLNTRVRRRPQVLEVDTLPLCLVAPGRERIAEQTFKKGVWYEYEVLVLYVDRADRVLEDGLSAWMQARQDLRDVLFQVLLPGTSVFDTDIDPEDVVEAPAWAGSNYAVTAFRLRFKVAETRTS